MNGVTCKTENTGPDENVEEADNAATDARSGPTSERGSVKDDTDKDRSDDRSETCEERDEGTCPAVEQESRDRSLVSVNWTVISIRSVELSDSGEQ